MSATISQATAVKQYKMFIDGEFVSTASSLPVFNPATEEIIS